ncbi:MAG: helix-turn-helix domain-containing protein [Prevotellaceae bacterium]|nr:helix-turn-helix domain-containing protein [Prevotellaceae bacterium]
MEGRDRSVMAGRFILKYIIFLFVSLSVHAVDADGQYRHFATLNTQQGLSDNSVRQMLQLPDGRMVIVTARGVNVYDGQEFRFLPLDTAAALPLKRYKGHTHLYVDNRNRLWIKSWQRCHCVDLRTFSLCGPQSGMPSAVRRMEDLYVDTSGRLWCVSGNTVECAGSGLRITIKPECGALQDLDTYNGRQYAFFAKGCVAVYDNVGRLMYTAHAFAEGERDDYTHTSLVVRSGGGVFYQIRTGNGRSVFLRFDAERHRFARLYSCDYILHTLHIMSDSAAVISTPHGYMAFNIAEDAPSPRSIGRFILPDGTMLTSGVNTIIRDREGGVWLGTYDKGVLYTSPLLGLFGTRRTQTAMVPLLTEVLLRGEPVQQGREYDGRVVQPLSATYTDTLTFSHAQNDVAFRFGAAHYVCPQATYYRYRVNDGEWRTPSAGDDNSRVDSRGALYLAFTDMPPGEYTLQVMASGVSGRWNGPVRTLHFVIQRNWWAVALVVFAVLSVVIAAAILLYKRRKRRVPSVEKEPDGSLTPQEQEFVDKVTGHIMQHIGDNEYGVEQLAADMMMERTGLYKKLTPLTGKSPVAYIRSIRLRKAAELLRQQRLTVAEVAESTGFTTAAYFTKCFKKEYGVTPTEFLGL